MGNTREIITEALNREHILNEFEDDAKFFNFDPDYYECSCGWKTSATDIPRRFSQFREHQNYVIDEYMREAKDPILPDPIGTSSDVYIRALIEKNHRPSQFGCSCGVIMASGVHRQAIFDFHINGILERCMEVLTKEIGGDCRG